MALEKQKMARKTPRVKTVSVKCGEFDIALNFKKGVKTTRLKVAKSGEISVSLPFYAAQKHALEFVQKHYEWLKSAHKKTLSNLPREDEFRLLGEVYRIKFEPNLKGVNLIRFASGSGVLNLNSLNLGAGAAENGKFDDFFARKFDSLGDKFDATESRNDPRLLDTKFEGEFCETQANKFDSAKDKFDPSEFNAEILENSRAKFDAGEFNPHLDEAKFKSADGRKFDGEIYAPGLAALENCKKAFARRIYGHFIAKFAPTVNRKINRVVVRKMTTRWGSCNSRKGYINLSLNLIEKAPDLVEYVVLHELAHLIYPHHQKSFYDFIAKLMPDFKAREKRLNKK